MSVVGVKGLQGKTNITNFFAQPKLVSEARGTQKKALFAYSGDLEKKKKCRRGCKDAVGQA